NLSSRLGRDAALLFYGCTAGSAPILGRWLAYPFDRHGRDFSHGFRVAAAALSPPSWPGLRPAVTEKGGASSTVGEKRLLSERCAQAALASIRRSRKISIMAA